MSLKELPRDIINIFLGLVQKDVKKETKEKSVVYMLVNINDKTAFTTSYFSRNLKHIKDVIKTATKSLDYISFYVNSDIESNGVYCFRRSGEIVKITVDNEEAEDFRKRFNFTEELERYFHEYEPESYSEFLYDEPEPESDDSYLDYLISSGSSRGHL